MDLREAIFNLFFGGGVHVRVRELREDPVRFGLGVHLLQCFFVVHRGFADQMLDRLRCCRWSASEPNSRPLAEALMEPLLLVYFPVLRLDRAEKAWRFLASLNG